MDSASSFSGHLKIIGFGSIAKATLALLLTQHELCIDSITVIAPELERPEWFDLHGIVFVRASLTEDNHEALLDCYVDPGDFLLNLSVGVSSLALIRYAARVGALYLDTCIEPWEGGYADPVLSASQRSNYALRHHAFELRKQLPNGPTAVIAHGANPGLISHVLKAALRQLAGLLEQPLSLRNGQPDWPLLAMHMGVKVVHIAERDTQRSRRIKKDNEFVNTWSVDGFISEGMQPAELAWGTHEKTRPADAHDQGFGAENAIYLDRPSASVSVKTWTPLSGPCLGLLITHHETTSIADLLTLTQRDEVIYRPTIHYAYHPCDDALLSVHEWIGRGWQEQEHKRVMGGEVVSGGVDALGVLLMGHRLNAYWYGSLLSIDEARELLPFNTATSLQVAAGVFSGMVWAVRHPKQGIVEAEQMDDQLVLALAAPYLGTVSGVQTDWRPTAIAQAHLLPAYASTEPWQFEHFTRY